MSAHVLFLQGEAPAGGLNLGRFVADFWPILVPVVLGLAALYLLLPRAFRYPPLWGGLLGGLALVVAGWWLVHFEVISAEVILFYAFAFLAVGAAGMMVTQSNPVYAALFFAQVVLSTCGLFLLLAAPFLMAATVIIYAGAIVVTFLFVIMLAQQLGPSSADQRSREPFLSALAGFVLLAAVLCVLQRTYQDPTHQAVAQQLQGFLEQTRKARDAKTVAEMGELVGDRESFVNPFLELVQKDSLFAGLAQEKRKAIQKRLYQVEETWSTRFSKPADKRVAMAAHLDEIYRDGQLIHAQLTTAGVLTPDPKLPLSRFSGGSPQGQPRDAHSRPQLPAENVAGLGRALFTDYLLAVELAGFLLTVATIGAIAIAARRTEELR
jgi:NADH:ubiquinone oxidoreductase subunit 6 (subunit J)